MNVFGQLSFHLDIAAKAIEVHSLATARKFAQTALNDAYQSWRERHGVEYVERDSVDWKRMMKSTKSKYAVVVEVKRMERNAKRRLDSAIRRFQSIPDGSSDA